MITQNYSPSNQKGVVLLAVLWVLAILVVITSAVALWMESALADIDNQWKRLDTELKQEAMLSRLQFLALTQRYTVAGLTTPSSPELVKSEDGVYSIEPVGNEWPLDGTPFLLKKRVESGYSG